MYGPNWLSPLSVKPSQGFLDVQDEIMGMGVSDESCSM